MAGFGDTPLVGPGSELQLTIDGRAVPHEEVLARLQVMAREAPEGVARLQVMAREAPEGDVGERLEDGVPIHRVSNRLGHADLRTTSRYAAEHPDQVDDVADVLDRRYQASRRTRC